MKACKLQEATVLCRQLSVLWKIVEAVPASVNPGAGEHVGVFAIWIPFTARETGGGWVGGVFADPLQDGGRKEAAGELSQDEPILSKQTEAQALDTETHVQLIYWTCCPGRIAPEQRVWRQQAHLSRRRWRYVGLRSKGGKRTRRPVFSAAT